MTEHGKASLQYRLAGGWDHAWKIALGLGILGTVLLGAFYEEKRFAFSYLFAFVVFLTMGLGGAFFVLIQHLTSAGWSVTVRRTAEFLLAGLPVFLLLFAPIYMLRHDLFPWLQHGHEAAQTAEAGEGEHGVQADEGSQGRADVEGIREKAAEHEHHEIMERKSGYLNEGFFTVRAALYFAAWILLAFFFFGSSTKQDETRDPQLTVRAQRWAPIMTFLFGFTLTFAMFDWVMSLDPSWFSTIFGVYLFAGSAVVMFALVILITLGLRQSGLLGETVNVEHYHDLGKLMFGFVVFHAYIGFSQMMLIWYASIPEELTFYQHRWHVEGWKGVSLFLAAGHFATPFVFLISRNVKRRLHLLGVGAAWLIFMHVIDIYWFVLPNLGALAPHALDFASLIAVGGFYFAAVFFQMSRHSLIPVGDPRLERALHFQNA